MLVNNHSEPVTLNSIVYLVGVNTTDPDAGFVATISAITDSFCVPLLSTAIVDFCSMPVPLVATVILMPVTVAPA